MKRSVGIDGAYSRCIVATRGIKTGSGSTSELRVLVMDVVVEVGGIAVMIKLYMDVLTLAACGLPQPIIQLMIKVVDVVVEQLEVHQLMEVYAKRSKVLAGRAGFAMAVAQAAKLPGTSDLFKEKVRLLRNSSARGSEAAQDKWLVQKK